MKFTILWVDRESAKVFHVSRGIEECSREQGAESGHHAIAGEQIDQYREPLRLFVGAAKLLSISNQFMIVGPGVAKHHFYNYLVEQRPELAKKIFGIASVDHLTEPQLVALSKRYFNRTAS